MSDERPQPPLPPEPEPASGSAASQWIAGLVREHFVPLYRLALAGLEDERSARRVALESLATALQRQARYSRRSDTLWLYELALKELSPKTRPAPAERPAPPSELEAAIWTLVDGFEQKEHLLSLLLCLLDWPDEPAARLLKVSAGAVHTQRLLFNERFAAALGEIPLAAPPSGPDELFAIVCQSLKKRWPAPLLSEVDYAALLEQVQQGALQVRRQPRPRWLAPAAAGLLLAGSCLTFGLFAYLAGLTPTIQLPLAATPVSTRVPPSARPGRSACFPAPRPFRNA